MAKVLQNVAGETIFNVDEMLTIETVLEMGTGYVLDFSDRTFNQFVLDNWQIDATAPAYTRLGTSKANRLRGMLQAFNDSSRADVLRKFVQYRDKLTPTTQSKEIAPEIRQRYWAIIESLEKEPTISAEQWTGIPSLPAQAERVRVYAPIALSGLDELIGRVEEKRLNDPEVQELLESLKELHRLTGELISSIERSQPITSVVQAIHHHQRTLFENLGQATRLFAIAPALSVGVSTLLASITGSDVDTTLLGSTYAALVAADTLRKN